MKEISPLNDCIDHPLNIGDYVTAIWANSELELFKVIGFERRNQGTRHNRADCIKLQRLFSDEENNSNDKPTYKLSSQVTWVDPEYVVIHFLSR